MLEEQIYKSRLVLSFKENAPHQIETYTDECDNVQFDASKRPLD